MIHYGTPSKCLLIGAVMVGASGCFGPGGVLGNDDGDPDMLFVGTISVTTLTTGPSPDPDGYTVALDEARVEPIGLNSGVTFYPVPPGTYGIRLDGVDGTCAVTGDNPVFVTVKADTTVTSHFDVACP